MVGSVRNGRRGREYSEGRVAKGKRREMTSLQVKVGQARRCSMRERSEKRFFIRKGKEGRDEY